jgi:hypothetical protein
MKVRVKYYDIENDSCVEKECIRVDSDAANNTFSFIPVDDPPRIYKSVVIDHPVISIHQSHCLFMINIVGYQYTKSDGYWKTTTKIYFVEED